MERDNKFVPHYDEERAGTCNSIDHVAHTLWSMLQESKAAKRLTADLTRKAGQEIIRALGPAERR